MGQKRALIRTDSSQQVIENTKQYGEVGRPTEKHDRGCSKWESSQGGRAVEIAQFYLTFFFKTLGSSTNFCQGRYNIISAVKKENCWNQVMIAYVCKDIFVMVLQTKSSDTT